MPAIHLTTLGCAKNTVSSNRIKEGLRGLGFSFVDDPAAAKALIVNTCGFIDAAKEESIDLLLQLAQVKDETEDRLLIAIGCLSQRYGEELREALPEVDAFIGIDRIADLPRVLGVAGQLRLDLQASDGEASAFLEISQGCDHRCSFCAIPGIQGAFRSREPDELLDDARSLASAGARELVLIAQDTGAYGQDLPADVDLISLLGRLSEIESVNWLRLMYLQWQYLNERFVEAIAERNKVCSYVDVPFQHAGERILRAMNRRGDKQAYLRTIEQLRSQIPDITLRTSIIVGFPGETDDDIDELADFIKEARFDYTGIFEYSSEEGTIAATLDGQISTSEKHQRSEQIRALADAVSRDRLQRWVGTAPAVLIERVEGSCAIGRTQHQAPDVDGEVLVEDGGHLKPGEIARVAIARVDDYDLIGKPA